MQETNPPVPVKEHENVELVAPQASGSKTGRNIAIIAGIIVVLTLFILAIYGMVTHPGVTEAIRDISIIVLALVSIVIGIFIIILTWQVWQLTRLVQDEIKPILDSTQRTVSTVRGTTEFVSDRITRPAIEAASMAAGIRAGVREALGLFRSNGRQRQS